MILLPYVLVALAAATLVVAVVLVVAAVVKVMALFKSSFFVNIIIDICYIIRTIIGIAACV